jgi:hypothetical protein
MSQSECAELLPWPPHQCVSTMLVLNTSVGIQQAPSSFSIMKMWSRPPRRSWQGAASKDPLPARSRDVNAR